MDTRGKRARGSHASGDGSDNVPCGMGAGRSGVDGAGGALARRAAGAANRPSGRRTVALPTGAAASAGSYVFNASLAWPAAAASLQLEHADLSSGVLHAAAGRVTLPGPLTHMTVGESKGRQLATLKLGPLAASGADVVELGSSAAAALAAMAAGGAASAGGGAASGAQQAAEIAGTHSRHKQAMCASAASLLGPCVVNVEADAASAVGSSLKLAIGGKTIVKAAGRWKRGTIPHALVCHVFTGATRGGGLAVVLVYQDYGAAAGLLSRVVTEATVGGVRTYVRPDVDRLPSGLTQLAGRLVAFSLAASSVPSPGGAASGVGRGGLRSSSDSRSGGGGGCSSGSGGGGGSGRAGDTVAGSAGAGAGGPAGGGWSKAGGCDTGIRAASSAGLDEQLKRQCPQGLCHPNDGGLLVSRSLLSYKITAPTMIPCSALSLSLVRCRDVRRVSDRGRSGC